MARFTFPSTFLCDCGHRLDFTESTVRELQELSQRSRRPVRLGDSGDSEHFVLFRKGSAETILCPELGQCSITNDGDDTHHGPVTSDKDGRRSKPLIRYTPKQGRYLAFIDHYTKLRGTPPAEADMQKYFRVTAPSVHQMVLTLERNCLIERTPGATRSIRILVPQTNMPSLETGQPPSHRSNWYPRIENWVMKDGGTISVGLDEVTDTWVRACRGETILWSGGSESDTYEELLTALDEGIASLANAHRRAGAW